MSANVIAMRSATWEAVREAWAKAQRLGWEAVREAAHVGQMLIDLKADPKTPHGAFLANARRALHSPNDRAASVRASDLMRLASNLPLLEKHRPESQRAALALIPKAKLSKAQRIERALRRENIDEEERPKTEEEHLSGFWARAWNARQWALVGFGGKKVDRKMIDEARACAAAWENLAVQLEEKLQ